MLNLPRPSTRAPALAVALFGDCAHTPGVHRIPPDADGYTWFAVVDADGNLNALNCVAPIRKLPAPPEPLRLLR